MQHSSQSNQYWGLRVRIARAYLTSARPANVIAPTCSRLRMRVLNKKRLGSIPRPPPERLGMSGWERLSAEGRSKRLKIWSPGLPISNPTSCNYYPPAPGAESIGNRLFRPLRPNVEPVPIRGTNPYFCAPQRCRRLECFEVGLRFFLHSTSPRTPVSLLTSLNGAQLGGDRLQIVLFMLLLLRLTR